MPQAAAHILVPLILMSLIRDYWIRRKGKKSFPLHYVLIAGIAGIIPDLDVLAYWVLYFFDFTIQQVHRTFMHSMFLVIIFLILAIVTSHRNIPQLGRHKLKLSVIFWMIAFGTAVHLILDALLAGYIMPFYPFSEFAVGLNLFGYLPLSLEAIAAPCLDAGLIVFYLIYLEIKHKISDFI
jgi:membrane-bound metal-dependent hydrolase YbcI (DUF457 family)